MSDLLGKLEDYRVMKAALAELKVTEMELRVDICEELGINELSAGTHNFEWADSGLLGKMSKKLNYKIDSDAYNDVKELLTEDEVACLKWTLDLRVGPYKKLADSDTLDMIITVTNAAPTLEISLEEV